MRCITDINDFNHRIVSATAVFQRGLCHLFLLQHKPDSDGFSRGLRLYQSIFDLRRAQLLMDLCGCCLRWSDVPKRVCCERCKDPDHPTREEIDPSAALNHGHCSKEATGFAQEHPLGAAVRRARELHERALKLRDNLIYRPFLVYRATERRYHWDNCDLIKWEREAPASGDIEVAYRDFFTGMVRWHQSPKWHLNRLENETWNPARGFILHLFRVYMESSDGHPEETLFSTYARMLGLNEGTQPSLDDARQYRNQLLDSGMLSGLGITQAPDWPAVHL